MKIRTGFVSNSSSSSFVIRKSALTEAQVAQIVEFYDKRNDYYCTGYLKDDGTFISGDLESHNTCERWEEDGETGGFDDKDTACVLFGELIDSFGVSSEDYDQRYEDYPEISGYERNKDED